jgi:hypothetical protein
MTLLKDLISIAERVNQGDFTLQLSKGVTDPDQTLRLYVVTPQLVDAFSNALGFIQHAVQTGGSKAAFLDGSFGSGKRPRWPAAGPSTGLCDCAVVDRLWSAALVVQHPLSIMHESVNAPVPPRLR